MLNHRVHTGIKVMVGFVGMLAYAEANEVDENTPTLENVFEVVVVKIGSDEVIEYTWNHPGYSFIEQGEVELAEAEANLLATEPDPQMPEKEPLGFELYSLVEGKPSELIFKVLADEEMFDMYGTAKASYPPPEQIIPLNTVNGDPVTLLLVHPSSFRSRYRNILHYIRLGGHRRNCGVST